MNTQLTLSPFTVRMHEIALWCWGLMLLVVPVSTALALLFSAFGGFFSISGLRWNLIEQTLQSPVVLAALALFTWLAVSMAWSVAPRDELIEGIWKYRKLVFVFLVAASIFACRKQPNFLINFFLIGCAVVTLGSLASRFGVLDLILGPPAATGGWPIGGTPTKSWLYIGGPENPTFGRNHITQGAFLVFAAMFAAGRAWAYRGPRRQKAVQVLWVGVSIFFLIPVFSIQGRSGYLLATVGGLFWVALGIIQGRDFKKLLVPLMVTLILSGLMTTSPHFFKRSLQAVDDVVQYSQTGAQTSQGERLRFWRAGLDLAVDRPIFGYGVGGYAQAYSELPNQPQALRESRSQPHSEWVILLVQGGAIGIFLFGFLVIGTFRELLTTPFSERVDCLGLFCVTGLFFFYSGFNSAVWDLAEGHFFVALAALVASRMQTQTSAP